MKKLYFLRTNGYDMIASSDNEDIRYLTETNDFPIHASKDEAMDFLSRVEDDSSWEVLDSGFDDVLKECEIIAEIVKEL